MDHRYLIIDQGTSSTRVSLFSNDGVELAMEQREITLSHPHDGWVELSPTDVATTLFELIDKLLGAHPGPITSIGITNQRETVLLWDKSTGVPVTPAIVWLDRRTAPLCSALASDESAIFTKTGLCLDPYFSATKIKWILDMVPGARARAERGELLAGTIDTYLIFLLSGGTVHATDATNASRTMLFNIHEQQWDAELCTLFTIPPTILPQVLDSHDDFGIATTPATLAGTPIRGVAGDQQAALIGQECFAPGAAKCTYGTGLFLVVNTGAEPVMSRSRLLATVAYRLAGKVSYAIEGSSFVAGSALRWARDQLGIITSYTECEQLVSSVDYRRAPLFVPAFHGLGAPYWNPDVRGALSCLNYDTGRAEILTALLLASAYQTRDLITAMAADMPPGEPHSLPSLRVDGGMTISNWFCQALADIVQTPVERSSARESTSRGAALLAEGITLTIPRPPAPTERTFEPRIGNDEAATLYGEWVAAVHRVLDLSASETKRVMQKL
jgi:glycerol kinase